MTTKQKIVRIPNARRIRHPYRYTAEKRTPAEWVKMIEKLPQAHQAIIGRVVWWDWFAERTLKNRVSEFDKWLAEPLCPVEQEPEPIGLIESAMALGYPQVIATQRFRVKFQKKTKCNKE